ncbi:MAG TPA: SGNH/GDSL hydrolase family protein [Pirellulaceae bacterium]|nr:SGNH/GDSL hydrolase family protein [Pirellulaceae bacterium]
MPRHIFLFVAVFALAPIARADEPAKPAESKWEKTIAAFEEQDKLSPPTPGGVVFYGSSSIRLWDLKKSFPDINAINRGFGGSQMSDAAQFVKRVVTPYKPRAIVLYEGDNDLNANKSPEQVAADFEALRKIVRGDLPGAKLIVIGCKPSPSRWKLIEKQRELNRLLAARCAVDEHAAFVDIEQPMLGTDGQPREELFRADKLHLSDAGYELWNSLVQPLIAP